jgi:hypothetical protein
MSDQEAGCDHSCVGHLVHLESVIVDVWRGNDAAVENVETERLWGLRLLLGVGGRETEATDTAAARIAGKMRLGIESSLNMFLEFLATDGCRETLSVRCCLPAVYNVDLCHVCCHASLRGRSFPDRDAPRRRRTRKTIKREVGPIADASSFKGRGGTEGFDAR